MNQDTPELVPIHYTFEDESEAWKTLMNGSEKFEVVRDSIVDQRRRVTVHKVILVEKGTGLFWSGWYELGFTEMQDGSEEVGTKLHRVQPYTRTVTDFRTVEVRSEYVKPA